MKSNSKTRGGAASAAATARAKARKKQKVQLVVMLGLVGVLVAVWLPLLGGEDGTASASAAPAAAPEAAEASPEEVEADDDVVPAAPDEPAQRNDVLSSEPDEDGLVRSPFASFWQDDEAPAQVPVEELEPPTVALSATAPVGDVPIAVLDGQLRYLGDDIQGWELSAITERRIELRSPNNTSLSIQMPLLEASEPLPELEDEPSAGDDDA